VETNGKELAQALRGLCGFQDGDNITVHVYAHSMGCLVARCMVDLFDGAKLVDKVVLAGPPNRGSTLANLSRGLVYLTTVLLNRFAAIPPLGVVNWLAEALYQQGAGIADLAVDAEIVTKLNDCREPTNVPYLILAGENVQNEAERNRLNRLAQKVLDKSLDTIFGEQNDVAIGVSSMLGFRGGDYPRLTTEELPCDHFSYFSISQGLSAVRDFIRE
jgi:pimeloyl-ACP methyl ester carboxylesterase